MSSKLIKVLGRWPRQTLPFLVGVILFSILFLPKLGSLIPGDSGFEQPVYLGVNKKSELLNHVSFAPIKLAEGIMVKIDHPNATLLRLVSVGTVFVAVLAFYLLISRWHTRRVAMLSTALFASSSYVLHLGRLANHEVIYLTVIPVLLLAGTWLKSKRHVRKLPLATFLACLLLYVPGVWIILLASGIAFRKRLLIAWKFVGKRAQIASGAIAGLTVLPLIYALASHPSQIKEWIGLNTHHLFSLETTWHQLRAIPRDLLVYGPNRPWMWLTHTPMIDVFVLAMTILGIYAYRRGRHPLRGRLLAGAGALSLVLFVFGGAVTLALVFPVIYILAAGGISRLLQSWFTVFPRNPFARNLAVGMVVFVVGLTCFYHIKRYYVAWPNAPETKQAFRTPPPK